MKLSEMKGPSGNSTASIALSGETPNITRITCVTVSRLENIAFTFIGVHSWVGKVWLGGWTSSTGVVRLCSDRAL